MFLINQAMVDVPIGTAALIVVLGMAVVFFGLILLMLVTKASGKIMQNKEAAAKAAAQRLRGPTQRHCRAFAAHARHDGAAGGYHRRRRRGLSLRPDCAAAWAG